VGDGLGVMLAEADVLGEAEEVAGAEDAVPAGVVEAVPDGVAVPAGVVEAVPDGVAVPAGVVEAVPVGVVGVAVGEGGEAGANWAQAAMTTRLLAGSALPPMPLRSTK
jgi:hypothetical protein